MNFLLALLTLHCALLTLQALSPALAGVQRMMPESTKAMFGSLVRGQRGATGRCRCWPAARARWNQANITGACRSRQVMHAFALQASSMGLSPGLGTPSAADAGCVPRRPCAQPCNRQLPQLPHAQARQHDALLGC
jgi:hypothetical protein